MISLLFSAVLVAPGCVHGDPKYHVRSLAGVREEAHRAAKGVLVELTASGCEPCAVFEREILPTPQFQAALRDVIFIRWDVDKSWGEDDYERELVGYSAVPFFVALDEDGVIRGTYRGLPPDANLAARVVREAALLSCAERRIKAIELRAPKDPENLLWVGRWYHTRGRKKEALERYERALGAPDLEPGLRVALEKARKAVRKAVR